MVHVQGWKKHRKKLLEKAPRISEKNAKNHRKSRHSIVLLFAVHIHGCDAKSRQWLKITAYSKNHGNHGDCEFVIFLQPYTWTNGHSQICRELNLLKACVLTVCTRKCFSYCKNGTWWKNSSDSMSQEMPYCVTQSSVGQISVDAATITNNEICQKCL